MNRKKTDIDVAYEKVMDAEAIRQDIATELGVFPDIDAHMDSHQEKGYAIVAKVMLELREDRPHLAGELRRAIHHFAQAEKLEALNEEHVASATEAVEKQEKPLHEATRRLDTRPREGNRKKTPVGACSG